MTPRPSGGHVLLFQRSTLSFLPAEQNLPCLFGQPLSLRTCTASNSRAYEALPHGEATIIWKGRARLPRGMLGQGRTKQDKANNLLDLEDNERWVRALPVDPNISFTTINRPAS